MPKGTMRARKPPFLDDDVKASIALGADIIHPHGNHDLNKRFYKTLIKDDGYKSLDEAKDIVRALHRAAGRVKVSMHATAEKKPLGGYRVKFCAVCKDCSRAYVIQTYGDDRSKWPYDPRLKLRKENNV